MLSWFSRASQPTGTGNNGNASDEPIDIPKPQLRIPKDPKAGAHKSGFKIEPPKPDDSKLILPSPTKGILLNAAATKPIRKKTVAFDPATPAADHHKPRPQPRVRSGLPADCPGKFPSPWTPRSGQNDNTTSSNTDANSRPAEEKTREELKMEEIRRPLFTDKKPAFDLKPPVSSVKQYDWESSAPTGDGWTPDSTSSKTTWGSSADSASSKGTWGIDSTTTTSSRDSWPSATSTESTTPKTEPPITNSWEGLSLKEQVRRLTTENESFKLRLREAQRLKKQNERLTRANAAALRHIEEREIELKSYSDAIQKYEADLQECEHKIHEFERKARDSDEKMTQMSIMFDEGGMSGFNGGVDANQTVRDLRKEVRKLKREAEQKDRNWELELEDLRIQLRDETQTIELMKQEKQLLEMELQKFRQERAAGKGPAPSRLATIKLETENARLKRENAEKDRQLDALKQRLQLAQASNNNNLGGLSAPLGTSSPKPMDFDDDPFFAVGESKAPEPQKTNNFLDDSFDWNGVGTTKAPEPAPAPAPAPKARQPAMTQRQRLLAQQQARQEAIKRKREERQAELQAQKEQEQQRQQEEQLRQEQQWQQQQQRQQERQQELQQRQQELQQRQQEEQWLQQQQQRQQEQQQRQQQLQQQREQQQQQRQQMLQQQREEQQLQQQREQQLQQQQEQQQRTQSQKALLEAQRKQRDEQMALELAKWKAEQQQQSQPKANAFETNFDNMFNTKPAGTKFSPTSKAAIEDALRPASPFRLNNNRRPAPGKRTSPRRSLQTRPSILEEQKNEGNNFNMDMDQPIGSSEKMQMDSEPAKRPPPKAAVKKPVGKPATSNFEKKFNAKFKSKFAGKLNPNFNTKVDVPLEEEQPKTNAFTDEMEKPIQPKTGGFNWDIEKPITTNPAKFDWDAPIASSALKVANPWDDQPIKSGDFNWDLDKPISTSSNNFDLDKPIASSSQKFDWDKPIRPNTNAFNDVLDKPIPTANKFNANNFSLHSDPDQDISMDLSTSPPPGQQSRPPLATIKAANARIQSRYESTLPGNTKPTSALSPRATYIGFVESPRPKTQARTMPGEGAGIAGKREIDPARRAQAERRLAEKRRLAGRARGV